MNNNQMTVKLWAELDDNQSEDLNGGYAYQPISIAGGVGALQVNGNGGTQINLVPIGKAPVYLPYFFGYYG